MDAALISTAVPADTAALRRAVTFHTSVILGSNFAGISDPVLTVSYTKDRRIHNRMPPQECESMPNGMVIELPLKDTEQYIRQYLFWLPRRRDETLVSGLASYLNESHSEEPKGSREHRPLQQLRACHIDILNSAWFRDQPDDQQQQIRQAIKRVQGTQDQPTNLLEVLLYRRLKLVRRDSHESMHEHEVALLTFRDNMKPRHIAERLGVSRNLVYNCLDRLKANLKAFLQLDTQQQQQMLAGNMPRIVRDRKTEDPERIAAVKAYIQTYGLQNVSLSKLKSYINRQLPHKPPVGMDSVRSMLLERLNLKYGPFNASRYRYEDPSYDEKRVQVCRLLAQFHLLY